ncbi:MAG: single-stranded DNA-binding protein [Tissierellia bacterium]|nr:single-stranded DNA-binding protein [Tissierellia bacterium]
MNSVVLIGRLVRDPELRYAAETGNPFGNFTIAVDRMLSRERKQENEAKGLPTADFIRILVSGKTAENCGNFLAKGRLVAVQGRIETGSYTNNQGQKVYTTDVRADRVQFLEWGDKAANQGAFNNSYQQGYQPQGGFQGGGANRSGGASGGATPNFYNSPGQNQDFNDGGFNDGDDDFIPFDDDSKIPF